MVGGRVLKMPRVLVVLLIAAVGGLVGLRLRIPSGALIGAMVTVAVANVAGVTSDELGTPYLIVAQIILGAIIGSKFDQETVRQLGAAWVSSLIVMVCLIMSSLGIGWVAAKIGGLDLLTAIFSSMPGGLSQITAAAEGMGVDARLVATVHLVRITVIAILVPLLASWLAKVK
jgi:membrane AbrB-like protein